MQKTSSEDTVSYGGLKGSERSEREGRRCPGCPWVSKQGTEEVTENGAIK